MAERRMFAKSIVLSDAFLDMPMSARCLYFTLNMLADDDGFINSPKSIIRQCGASEDDLRVLLAKRFVIGFESGVIVIKHWRVNNYLRNDRHCETNYKEELSQLELNEIGAYSERGIPENDMLVGNCLPSDNQMPTTMGIPSIGKDSIGKDNNICASSSEDAPKQKKRFIKPTLEEVKAYISEHNYSVNAEKWMAYYESNGWMVGRNHMKDWKAAVRTWNSNRNNFQNSSGRDRSFDSTDGKECLFL